MKVRKPKTTNVPSRKKAPKNNSFEEKRLIKRVDNWLKLVKSPCDLTFKACVHTLNNATIDKHITHVKKLMRNAHVKMHNFVSTVGIHKLVFSSAPGFVESCCFRSNVF